MLWIKLLSANQITGFFIFGMQINMEVFFGCVQPGMANVPKIRSLHIPAISPEKKGWGDVNFLSANEHKSFLQVDSILWVCLARHAESTQNNKFTISL